MVPHSPPVLCLRIGQAAGSSGHGAGTLVVREGVGAARLAVGDGEAHWGLASVAAVGGIPQQATQDRLSTAGGSGENDQDE